MNIDSRSAIRTGEEVARSGRFWLLRPILPDRFGRWLSGGLIFVLLAALFGLAGSLADDGLDEVGIGVALFFSLILA
ncbi:MAG: hypothetical protein AB7I04_16715 [Pseudomonadales bacterium]